MRCCGLTKSGERCKNRARWINCRKHLWQPIALLVTAVGAISAVLGLWPGWKANLEQWRQNENLKGKLTVEVKKGLRTKPGWTDDLSPQGDRSDVVTLLNRGQPVRSLALNDLAEDQRFKDYPPTMPLTMVPIPTHVDYQVAALGGSTESEVILTVTNEVYGLHPDELVSVLIYDATGKLVARTPYPREVLVKGESVYNPYSAFRTTGSLYDEVSRTPIPVTYSNDFDLITVDGVPTLQFAWVVDNGAKADQHLLQVERFQFQNGGLVSIGHPMYVVSDNFYLPKTFHPIENVAEIEKFLRNVAIPPFAQEMHALETADATSSPSKKRAKRLVKSALPASLHGVNLPPDPAN